MKQGVASVDNSNGQKAEPSPRAINPCAVAQLGSKQGRPKAVEPIKAGRGYNPVKFGNEVALNCAGPKAGPGCDREVQKSGSQGVHGKAPDGKATGGPDIFSQFPPSKELG